MGQLLQSLGRVNEAVEHYREALDMRRKLYPADTFPRGHPELVSSLNFMGQVLFAAEPGEARKHLLEALRIQQAFLQDGTALASETQALALLRGLPRTRDGYLSVTWKQARFDSEACGQVWLSRAFVTRLLHQRQSALRQVQRGSPLADKAHELQNLRERIEQLIVQPGDTRSRDARLGVLTRRRDELERELVRLLPRRDREEPTSTQLQAKLPANSAFIDLVRYNLFQVDQSDPKRRVLRKEARYIAFVLVPGQPIRRIELEAAATIDATIATFRQDIQNYQEGKTAADLWRQVWAPIAAVLPKQTQTLFLATDGNLTRLPFAALPASKPGHSILLEDYTLVHVPHGPFLLERLLQPWKPTANRDRLLLLGDLDYGPAEEAQAAGRQVYELLPASAQEMQAIRRLAGSRSTVTLDKTSATARRVREELSRARLAHLAIHGYFDEKALSAEKRALAQFLKEGPLDLGRPVPWVGRGSLSPLAYTGLVLSGANRKETAEGGILTGEGLWNLPLDGLELAVLSACETGLGELTEGEGVVGLQRTLHLAGCRDVIASLWNVPDGSTAVLMEEFYRRLWDAKGPLPAVDALRQAQLWVYRHPDEVLARVKEIRERSAKTKLVRLPNEGQIEKRKFSPARFWAAFILSGDGGLIHD